MQYPTSTMYYYGNAGCLVFMHGVQNQKDFVSESIYPKETVEF